MTRIARSLEVLGGEVLDLSPLTTLYYYDDTRHVDSDHDPNPQGVICGLDIMAGHGLDLQWLADEILKRRNPDLKYVIYNRRIASANTGWEWAPYYGSNPHTDHIHVSVGVGADGYSRQPYDDIERWLDMGDIFCKKGDKNDAVKSLQLGLNRVWKGEERYNGKDIVTVTGIYDAATCKAVYTILSGPVDGALFHPEMHWRLMDKHAALYAGKQGPEGDKGDKGDDGDKGDAAVLAPGTVLKVQVEPS